MCAKVLSNSVNADSTSTLLNRIIVFLFLVLFIYLFLHFFALTTSACTILAIHLSK